MSELLGLDNKIMRYGQNYSNIDNKLDSNTISHDALQPNTFEQKTVLEIIGLEGELGQDCMTDYWLFKFENQFLVWPRFAWISTWLV
jgi:hypothetical protein